MIFHPRVTLGNQTGLRVRTAPGGKCDDHFNWARWRPICGPGNRTRGHQTAAAMAALSDSFIVFSYFGVMSHIIVDRSNIKLTRQLNSPANCVELASAEPEAEDRNGEQPLYQFRRTAVARSAKLNARALLQEHSG